MRPNHIAVIALLACGWALPAQGQTVSGFESTSFNLSFDLSSGPQMGMDSPDLVFRNVTFGVEHPLTSNLGLWATVSKAADFNRDATDMRKLTGSFGGGLSYKLTQGEKLTLTVLGGIESRLERIADRNLNPTALRLGAKIGYRVLGDPGTNRWFGFFLEGGPDIALRDVMSATYGDILKGGITYHARAGLEFSL